MPQLFSSGGGGSAAKAKPGVAPGAWASTGLEMKPPASGGERAVICCDATARERQKLLLELGIYFVFFRKTTEIHRQPW